MPGGREVKAVDAVGEACGSMTRQYLVWDTGHLLGCTNTVAEDSRIDRPVIHPAESAEPNESEDARACQRSADGLAGCEQPDFGTTALGAFAFRNCRAAAGGRCSGDTQPKRRGLRDIHLSITARSPTPTMNCSASYGSRSTSERVTRLHAPSQTVVPRENCAKQHSWKTLYPPSTLMNVRCIACALN